MSKIKICGLRRLEDVDAVNMYMPDYAGFVLVPGRRRAVSHEQAGALGRQFSSGIQAVGVFVDEDREIIASLLERGIIDVAQLHGQEPEEDIAWLKSRTGKTVIKAVSVKTVDDVKRWHGSAADGLLLDNGAGGSGQAFDWSIAADAIADGSHPIWLAGGINADNIEAALALKPYAVDISGGVETDGHKDAGLIKEVVRRVRNQENDKPGQEPGK